VIGEDTDDWRRDPTIRSYPHVVLMVELPMVLGSCEYLWHV
jgi:hypothetical protein